MGTWLRRTILYVVLSFSLVLVVCGCAPAGPPSGSRGDQPEHGPGSATGAAKSASDSAGDGKGIEVEPVLQARNARCRALLVGVNDYERLKDLQFCGQDVTALGNRLAEIGFERDAVKCLTTGDADSARRPSKRRITEGLDALFAGLDAESVLIIALSGHGGSFDFKDIEGNNRQESFYCPKDARLHDPAGTMISIRSIYDRLEKCPARFKLLVVDACRDPHFVASDVLLAGHSAVDEAKSMASFARSLSDGRLPKATVAWVSCTSGEQSWEDTRLEAGIFMHYVLEALAGKADTAYRGDHNGRVSYRELKDYVRRETSDHVWKVHGGASQTPVFYDNWELRDFDLVKLDTRPQRPEPLPQPKPQRPEPPPQPKPQGPEPLPQPKLPRLTGKIITNSIGMRLVLIPAGEFMMGSPESEEGPRPGEKQHRVRITRPFYFGAYEVTQEQYVHVMAKNRQPEQVLKYLTPEARFYRLRGENPSEFSGATRPVENVSWNDAVEFCRKLSLREGRTYRLPTEAEWEYACRAGTRTRYYWGDSDSASAMKDYCWQHKYPQGTKSVGQKRANAWGLYDMSGNVSEWCQDGYGRDYYANSPTDDPRGASYGSSRVIRGGGWNSIAWYCRSAYRDSGSLEHESNNLGFRVALVPAE